MADFFDKVKEGFDKGISMVSVRSKELLEVSRIKGQIGTLSEQKKNALEELGSTIYTMYQQGGLELGEAVGGICGKIADLEGQIGQKEEELRKVRREARKTLGLSICANCGEELADEDKFCRKCGQKVE